MNDIETERNKKLREQIKNDLKLVKLQAQIRQNNEDQLHENLGIQKSLLEFHKPVTDKIEGYEESRIQNLKAIQNTLENLNISNPPEIEAIEDVKELYKDRSPTIYNADQGLDLPYLKLIKLTRPSKLIRDVDKTDEMYAKAKNLKEEMSRKKGNLKSTLSRAKNLSKTEIENKKYELNDVEYKESILEKYMNRLAIISGSFEMVSGTGLNDSLEILSQLTDKICKGSKNKKLHNQVVVLLDKLLKEGTMTSEDVKKYYENFLP